MNNEIFIQPMTYKEVFIQEKEGRDKYNYELPNGYEEKRKKNRKARRKIMKQNHLFKEPAKGYRKIFNQYLENGDSNE